MDVAQWLQDLGLPNYEALFREQAIDADVLPSLTDADFEKLGVPLGHRKKLLTAIAALNAAAASTAPIRRALPFPDGSFDVAYCQLGLQFFADRPAALREMRRVLATKGRLAVMVWCGI